MKIKTFNTKTNISFSRFVSQETVDSDITLDYNISFVGNTLKLTIKNVEENRVYYNISLDYALITQHREFDSQTLWEIPTAIPFGVDENGVPSENGILTSTDIKNKLRETYFDRGIKVTNYGTVFSPVRIFVPSKNSSLADCIICVPTPNEVETEPPQTGYTNKFTVTFSGDAASADFTAANDTGWIQLCDIPQVTETNRTSDTISVQVTVADPSIPEVWLEAVYGNVNTGRVPLTNGTGSFDVITTGLPAGNPIRVKLGYKYTNGIANFTTTV